MRKRYPKTKPEEIVEEIMRDRPPTEPERYEFANGTFVGDIFYSSIQSYIKSHWGKKAPYSVFDKVCNLLRDKGYWVHS